MYTERNRGHLFEPNMANKKEIVCTNSYVFLINGCCSKKMKIGRNMLWELKQLQGHVRLQERTVSALYFVYGCRHYNTSEIIEFAIIAFGYIFDILLTQL